MSKIVARMQKMKAENLIGIGNHNQRKTKNHSNPDIDTSLSERNFDLVSRTENYKTDIENFINQNKSTTRALRKDAVLINEWIISSDQKFFENLSEEETKYFFISAKDYFAQKFGEENIRYATVHLDETTPHMHMGIVPFDKDKKLSAKRVFSRQALRDVQEELPKFLQEKGFEIERGVEGSERKNLTVPEFKKLKEEEKEIQRKIESKKQELKAYVKETKIEAKMPIKAKKEFKEVKVPSGEKLLGFELNKTVKKPTGNLIISNKDFSKLEKAIQSGQEKEAQLDKILSTDVHKQNRQLKASISSYQKDNEMLIREYNLLAEKFNDIREENESLRATVGNLRQEIRLTYQSTKQFLKERTGDLKAFKTVFKDLVDTISLKLRKSDLESNFKREYDKEIKKERSRGMSR